MRIVMINWVVRKVSRRSAWTRDTEVPGEVVTFKVPGSMRATVKEAHMEARIWARMEWRARGQRMERTSQRAVVTWTLVSMRTHGEI